MRTILHITISVEELMHSGMVIQQYRPLCSLSIITPHSNTVRMKLPGSSYELGCISLYLKLLHEVTEQRYDVTLANVCFNVMVHKK